MMTIRMIKSGRWMKGRNKKNQLYVVQDYDEDEDDEKWKMKKGSD